MNPPVRTPVGPSDVVRVYDFASKRLYHIPAAELAPGMVRVTLSDVPNVDGEVWVDADELKWGKVRHRKLPLDLLASLEAVYATFDDVLTAAGLDRETWLDGFRRDADPSAEAQTWAYLAWVYERVTGLADFSLRQRCGVFNILLACSMTPRQTVRNVIDARGLTLPQREAIIDLYYLGTETTRRRAA